MPPVRFRDFRRGWWPAGAPEAMPSGTLRRAKGIHSVKAGTIRSRWGSTGLFQVPGTIHSLFRFVDARFRGVGSLLYRNNDIIKAGLSTEPLSFVKMPSTAGKVDSLFVAGGGDLFKVDAGGVVAQWGIDAPPDGFTAVPIAITAFQFDDSTVTFVDVTAASRSIGGADVNPWPTAEALNDIFYVGTSVKFNPRIVIATAGVAGVALWEYWNGTTWVSLEAVTGFNDNTNDLKATPGSYDVTFPFPSDWAKTIVNSVELFWLRLRVTTVYSTNPVLSQVVPIGVLSGVFKYRVTFLNSTTGHRSNANPTAVELPGSDIPGPTTNPVARDNGSGSIAAGVYKYRVTFLGGDLRSKPNPVDVTITLAASRQVWLSEIPVSPDPRVAAREVWRTKAGGSVYFLLTTIADNTATAFGDNVADGSLSTVELPLALDRQRVSLAGLPISSDPQVDRREIWRTGTGGVLFFLLATINDNTTTVFEDNILDADLSPTELPLDNDPPEDTFGEAIGPHVGRMWWSRDSVAGRRGRLYYSPIGRAESLSAFIDVSTDDDPVQRLVLWNRSLYAFTPSGIVRLVGVTEPFSPVRIDGAPGTNLRRTIVPTPLGIVYQAADGLRLFNGVASTPTGADAVGGLFRGEAAGGVAAFEGTVAAFANNEFIVSDGVTTLALNLADVTWREVGVPVTALYFEDDMKLLTGALNDKHVILEAEGALADDNAAIPFDVETWGVLSDAAVVGVILRVYIEADTAGQVLIPTVVLDGAGITLPALITSKRETVEYATHLVGRLLSVRLQGSLSQRVEVFGVEADVYIPSQASPVAAT